MAMMLHVSIPTVDGGLQEFSEPDSIITRLAILRRNGYEGKELVHELLTDDWAAPPVGVRITGTLEDGTRVNEYVPYK